MAHITRRLVAIPALGLATSIAFAPAALAQEDPTQSNTSSQGNSASVSQYNSSYQSNSGSGGSQSNYSSQSNYAEVNQGNFAGQSNSIED